MNILFGWTMAEIQTPLPAEHIAGTARSSGVDKDALIARLDALLEQYLYTLDEYEKLMQQLSKQLSSVCSDARFLLVLTDD